MTAVIRAATPWLVVLLLALIDRHLRAVGVARVAAVARVNQETELHTAIIRHVAERGFAPPISALRETLGWSESVVRGVLARLAEIRGVILKPNSADVWAIHPFTLMPTPTWVETESRGWWANCLGALLESELRFVRTYESCRGWEQSRTREFWCPR